ncbi:MAG: hypothetical protein ACRD1B_02170 [Thermoanaerobaculia bacterium]
MTPAPGGDVLVGVSVSGGGSRAALFAAGALEALATLRVGPEQRSLQAPCDRDLTLLAAAKVVAQNEDKIRKFLEQ